MCLRTYFSCMQVFLLLNNLVCGAPTPYLESTAFGARMSVPHRTFFVVERITRNLSAVTNTDIALLYSDQMVSLNCKLPSKSCQNGCQNTVRTLSERCQNAVRTLLWVGYCQNVASTRERAKCEHLQDASAAASPIAAAFAGSFAGAAPGGGGARSSPSR